MVARIRRGRKEAAVDVGFVAWPRRLAVRACQRKSDPPRGLGFPSAVERLRWQWMLANPWQCHAESLEVIMDETLVALLALTLRSYALLQRIANLDIKAHILVARQEATRRWDISGAEPLRSAIGKEHESCDSQFSALCERLEAYAFSLVQKRGNPDDKEALAKVIQQLERTFTKAESAPVSAAEAKMRWAFRYACSDGTVAYGGPDACDPLDSALKKLFGKKGYCRNWISLTDPDQQYIPEMRALFSISTGAFDVPDTISDPPERWRCIYRIACPGGAIHFADGGVAYDRLYGTLKLKYPIRKCRIEVVALDKLPKAWKDELKGLYGTSNGGYAISFPPEPPKRPRRKTPCPSCGSAKVGPARLTENGWERKCGQCKRHFKLQ